MANVELITCDFAGCYEPYAYVLKGFNLCSKHYWIGYEEMMKQVAKGILFKPLDVRDGSNG
jgi:hypothetical protein